MRRLLIVDSSVSARSPTMRSWLAAAPAVLPQRFDEVEIWGFHCELNESWVKWRRITPVTKRWAIQSIFYDLKVRKMMNRTSDRYRSETLIQCTGTHLPKTDVRYIQFWNTAYAEAALERPDFLRLPLKDRIVGPLLRREERLSLLPGRTGEWWCVSRGISAPIIRDSTVAPIIRYLPNAYNSARFNQNHRESIRHEMRSHYHFKDDDIVFSFSAFGHFERKGLRQAAQAVASLRASGHPVRLLVLGGKPGTIRSFRASLSRLGIDAGGLHFAGLVPDMEKHLSAADAFFMPSHFEAFSLAEIEAAALGLRLYLTAHPGHEMILREGTNGRLLPWEPAGMAAILGEEIRSGIIRIPHREIGEALNADAYAAAMAANYDAAIRRKWGEDKAGNG
ncbi:MAG: glycosyltransferase [Akkermansiaceae bacterium]|nr:glycosyltransferase [Akkermansiaceae bacterium]